MTTTITTPEVSSPSPSPAPADMKQAQAAALSQLSRPQKLELFLTLCQQGHDTISALHQSGIHATLGYDPTQPQAEVMIEELFFTRCQVRIDTSRPQFPFAIIPDQLYDPAQARPGDLLTSQFFALVDWLYFVRALPLNAIAKALAVPPEIVAKVKSDLSQEFAKAIRRQNGEAYLGDLLRTKELLRADLMMRRSKLDPRAQTQAAVQIDRLLYELENRFIDRLQEIGLIDKIIGTVEVNEEWHVTVSPAGAPVNKKVPQLEASNANTYDSTSSESSDIIELAAVTLDNREQAYMSKQSKPVAAVPGPNDHEPGSPSSDHELNSLALAGAVALKRGLSATISVEELPDSSEGSD